MTKMFKLLHLLMTYTDTVKTYEEIEGERERNAH